MDLANPQYMNTTADLTNVLPGVQQALLGQQQIQQNQNVLDEQRRANAAREAAAKIATTPNLDDATFESLLAPIAQADPNAAAGMRRQRAMQADIATLKANPNAQTIGKFMMSYGEEAAKPIKAAWDMMNGAQKEAALKTNADVYSLLASGKPDMAVKVLEQHKALADQTGEDADAYEQLIETIKADPKAGQSLAGISLSVALGADKFTEAFGKIGEEERADQLQPAALRTAQAKASQEETTAQFAPAKAQSDLATAEAQRQKWSADIANDIARLALDRDKLALDRDALTSNIQLKLEELDRNGTQLDAGARQVVNTAVGNAASAQALADRANNLADRIKGANMGWGWMSSAREAWKGAFGGQDPITGLRSEYQTLVNSQAVKNLPPGPASDKDIALAKQGFPPANAGGPYLESFLRGMAKMQQAVAASEDRKANWVSVNGSLAPVRRDTNIAGVMVPAGTTFIEFNNNALKRARQGETPGSLSGIINKYGNR